MWYNKKENVLQTEPPYRGWLHKDEVPILYPEWKEVGNDFKLPIKAKTESEKLAELDAGYKETFNSLAYAMSIAQLNADTAKVDILRSTYNSKRQSYAQERSAIKNG